MSGLELPGGRHGGSVHDAVCLGGNGHPLELGQML